MIDVIGPLPDLDPAQERELIERQIADREARWLTFAGWLTLIALGLLGYTFANDWVHP